MKYCENCGAELNENADVCVSCGKALKKAKKGNGKAVASMVLGIIAVCWAVLSLCSLGNIEPRLVELLEDTTLSEAGAKISFGIGYNLLSRPCGIIGLILGVRAKKNGKAIAGIVTSSIALLVAFIAYIVIFAV